MREKAEKGFLRGSKTAKPEDNGNHRQEYRRAQENSARFPIQQTKASKRFPHWTSSLAANHFPPAALRGRSNSPAAAAGQHHILPEVVHRPLGFSPLRSPAPIFT